MWSRRNKLIVGILAVLLLILTCVCGLVFGSNVVQTPTPLPVRATENIIVASETPTIELTETATIEPSLTSTLVPTWTNEPTATFIPTSTFAPTSVPVVKPTKEIIPTKEVAPTEVKSKCDPSYPTVCIPPKPPDLDCGDISYRRFKVLPPDPHGFDGDGDGVGCES